MKKGVGCRTECLGLWKRAWQYVSSERRCLILAHLSALMGWCNCPSLPRWPSWSERRALMMLNYVNIILNWLFNEVSGFADQPRQHSSQTSPLCCLYGCSRSVKTLNTLMTWSYCLTISLKTAQGTVHQILDILFDVFFVFFWEVEWENCTWSHMSV